MIQTCVFAIGCRPAEVPSGAVGPPGESIASADELANAQALAIFDDATVVETFRLRKEDNEDFYRRSDDRYKHLYFDGVWPIAKRGPNRAPYFARWLKEFMTDEKNFYVNASPKGCLFQPSVGFRIRAGSRTIELAVCFDCGDLTIAESEGKLKHASNDFSPGYQQLLAFALDVFPKDAYLLKQQSRGL